MSTLPEPTTKSSPTSFEVTGIERVDEKERLHTQLMDTMWLWWSANTVIATVALGTLNTFFGLGFWGSTLVIIVFNVLGVLPVAILSTLGPKTGLAQMPLSRFAFGYQGAKLPALLNAFSCLGWNAVNSVIGSSLLVTWSGGWIPQWAALIFLTVATSLVSVYGYFVVHRYERIAWLPMLLFFCYIFFVASPHFNVALPTTVKGMALFVSIASFGGAVFGFAVGWAPYAADYTRHQPANTSARRVFLYAFLGVGLPCMLFEILGVLLTTGATGNDLGTLIAHSIGTSPLSRIIILLLAFSTIANNVPGDYSFALSTQALGLKVVRRWILTIVGAVIYLALAFAISANFNVNLQGFLLLIAYWLGAWCSIVLIEHFMRKGNYPVEDYETASRLPVGIAALSALIVGLALAALGVNQASVMNFEGPLAHALADADIGFPLAIILAGLIYYPLRRWELVTFQR
ncbi:MAG TPA: cytosine permease [Ktedonobacteraceae bacterium]|nr:cytosine permease [Ktedonobacteraceae bacterium]